LKKKITVLYKNQSDFEFFYRNKNFCLELIKNFKDVKFINLEKKIIKKIDNNYKKYFLNILRLNQLKKYFGSKKDFLCILFLEKKISNYKYFKSLNQNNIKVVEIFRGGDLRQAKYFFNSNFFDVIKKIYKIILVNINFFVFSISYYLKILPKTNILFHYNKDSKDQVGYCFSDSYKTSITYILKKLFLIKELFFDKIYLINPRSYDEVKKRNYAKKYIVFLDSCFDHNDRYEFDKKPEIKDKMNYYKEIKLTFKNVKNFVFCVHPNTNMDELKIYLRNIKIVKFKTRDYIKKSKLVFFHESSSMLDALYLKKKIILLNSNYLGKYFKFRNLLYSKELNLKTFNLSKINDRIKISKLLSNDKINNNSNKKIIYSVNSKKRGLVTLINILKKYIS
jgi:hypothetical protein